MKNVLVVVDMQNDFIDQALGTKEAVEIVPAVVAQIGNPAYDAVIATLDTHGADYMETNEGRHLPVVHCVRGTKGWELNPQVRAALEARGAEYIEKPTFGSEVLLNRMKEEQPDTVTFVGLCTDICVVSNALAVKMALYEKDVAVIEAATAGVTPEAKAAALATMRSCQIEVR